MHNTFSNPFRLRFTCSLSCYLQTSVFVFNNCSYGFLTLLNEFVSRKQCSPSYGFIWVVWRTTHLPHWTSTSHLSNSAQCQRPTEWYFLETSLRTILAGGIPGEVFCTWQCNKDPSCKHFNYKALTLSCEMYYNDQTCFLRKTNCVFFQVTR